MIHDIRDGFRALLKNRGFAAVAILTLTLGIGMTTAIVSVADAVLLRPVPMTDIDRLVMIWETDRASGTTHEPASLPDFLDFKQRSRRVGDFAAFIAGEVNLMPDDGEPSRVAALNVSERFLPMLGIEPIVGRPFTAAEDTPGGGSIILISEDLWQRQFQRDPRIVGRTLRLNDRPRTIIGVVPASADFGILQVLRSADYSRGFAQRDARTTVDVFAPLQGDPQRLPRETHPIFVLGRLAAGSSLESARQELGAIAADLEKTYPVNEARGVFVQPLRDVILGPSEPALLVLLVAVGVVLLIACVNVAHLLLARGTVRAREIAVRKALGAGVGRLVRQFVVENTVLMLVAAVLGVILASVALRVLLIVAPPDIPRLADVAIDARVLAAVVALSLGIGFVFGLVPLVQSRRGDLQTALKSDVSSWSDRRPRKRLCPVAADGGGDCDGRGAADWGRPAHQELLASAAGESRLRRRQGREGRIPIAVVALSDEKEIQQFNARLLARALALPGVEAAAIAGNHPLDAGFTNSFEVVGREAEARDWPEISVRRVSPGYFRVLHVPLVRGRLLSDSDDAQAAPVVLINEETVRRFFSRPGSGRPAALPVRLAADDCRSDWRREDPRNCRGNPDRRLPACCAGAFVERHTDRESRWRSDARRRLAARGSSGDRSRFGGVRRGATRAHPGSIDGRTAIHGAAGRCVRGVGAGAGGHRHPWRSELQRRPAQTRNRHPRRDWCRTGASRPCGARSRCAIDRDRVRCRSRPRAAVLAIAGGFAIRHHGDRRCTLPQWWRSCGGVDARDVASARRASRVDPLVALRYE